MKSKTLSLCILTLFAVAPLSAQDTQYEATAEELGPFLLSPAELDELLGPVALHPDALVALILPAATAPEDIVLAARFLERNGDDASIDEQSWDESVKSLARYPDLIDWLNENLEWTIQVGDAFTTQPADVMKAIQRLRSLALDAGTLTNTREQYVVQENNIVRIVPANPTVIYVPYYDPAVVYVRRTHFSYVPRSFFSFSIGFRVGSWLTYDCDWAGNRIWYVENRRYWNTYRDWRNPRFPGIYGYVPLPHRHPWNPPPRRYRDIDRDHHRSNNEYVDSRPNVSPRRENGDYRRRDGRDSRSDFRRAGPDTNRRDSSPNRDRTITPNRNRDNTVEVRPTRDRRPDNPQPTTRVASPREKIVNILRNRPSQPSAPPPQTRPNHTRPENQPQRVASRSQIESPAPRVASPRERVVNVLRSQSQPSPAQVRASAPRSNRSSERQAAAPRAQRQAPVVIHGRTISRNDSQSAGQSTNSDQDARGRRGRGR